MRHTNRRTIRRHRAVVWAGLLLLAAAVCMGGGAYFYNAKHQPEPKVVRTARRLPKPESEGLATRMLFVGDVFWGRSVQTSAQKSGLGYAYPTSKLTTEDRAAYDAWIANFECPVTAKDVPYQLQVDDLKFNCRPEYLPNFAQWFTAVSLANNHTMNNDGKWGLEQSRTNLQAAGIQYFGTYDMSQTDDLCEVVTVPATATRTHAAVTLPVALCGYMYVVDVAPTDAQLAVMQRYAKVMPVIAMPHMGVEYRTTAEEAKVAAYRRMIDNGADMVVGAHPHVIQNSEAYKGKLIAYSVGNFLFDQQVLGRDTTLGLGVGVRLTIDDPAAAKVYADVAAGCAAYKDACLERLSAQLAARPKITVDYSFACYDEAKGTPALATSEVCDQVKQRATVDQLAGLAPAW